jgi:DinB superfamily
MSVTAADRHALIQRYAEGPARLRRVVGRVPEAGLKWRPGPGEWSVHEIVCHCADAETNAAARIRYLTAERDPLVLGFDQEAWATTFEYHDHPLDLALAAVEAVRANTTALIRRLPDAAWTKEGRHTESGRYTAEDWLRTYAAHLEEHVRQIESNLAASTQRARLPASMAR